MRRTNGGSARPQSGRGHRRCTRYRARSCRSHAAHGAAVVVSDPPFCSTTESGLTPSLDRVSLNRRPVPEFSRAAVSIHYREIWLEANSGCFDTAIRSLCLSVSMSASHASGCTKLYCSARTAGRAAATTTRRMQFSNTATSIPSSLPKPPSWPSESSALGAPAQRGPVHALLSLLAQPSHRRTDSHPAAVGVSVGREGTQGAQAAETGRTAATAPAISQMALSRRC